MESFRAVLDGHLSKSQLSPDVLDYACDLADALDAHPLMPQLDPEVSEDAYELAYDLMFALTAEGFAQFEMEKYWQECVLDMIYRIVGVRNSNTSEQLQDAIYSKYDPKRLDWDAASIVSKYIEGLLPRLRREAEPILTRWAEYEAKRAAAVEAKKKKAEENVRALAEKKKKKADRKKELDSRAMANDRTKPNEDKAQKKAQKKAQMKTHKKAKKLNVAEELKKLFPEDEDAKVLDVAKALEDLNVDEALKDLFSATKASAEEAEDVDVDKVMEALFPTAP